MDLIATHANADFDALASMIAARKLYPNARLVLPGSQERAVREFMSLSEDLVKIEYEKDVSIDDVKRLILVETRFKDRIGRMGELLGKKGIEIHVYDHHPRTGYDIKATLDVFKKVGATTTILTEIIKRRGIKITPLEATIMALGIYEDTGSLTFPTTTKADIDMVSFLISQGADLNLVSSFLRRQLSDEELKLLAELIKATEVHIINGVNVAIAASACESYVEDLSLLAYKLEEVENYNVIFVMVQSQDKIQFIARSRLSFVNVAKICDIFGGGGHPSAAGAIIKDLNLTDTKTKLIKYLRRYIRPRINAKDLIATKFMEIDLNEIISETKKKMLESDTEYAIVRDRQRIVGIITVKDLNKAISRGFGHSRVKGYMSGKVFPVKSNTPIYTIQKIMHEKDVGCLPVVEEKKLLGVITRSDLMRALHGELFQALEKQPISAVRQSALLNLASQIKRAYPKKIVELLKLIGSIADEMRFKAFAVGGFVRDLLLGVENFDIDIVIEGDSIDFARRFAKEVGGDYIYHKRFGTATVTMPCPKGIPIGKLTAGAFKIDVAMTRTEVYERPAALPTVKFGPIENDLFRRDFTINAMAFRLNALGFGELLDPFNGRKDLKEGKIRVLHDLSFVDDPTRIFRAVRFEQRFNFEIEPHTENLIKNAVGLRMIDRTQKQRIREEIIAILSEAEPFKGVKRLSDLNELRFIHKDLKLKSSIAQLFDSVGETLSWYARANLKRRRSLDRWLIYFMALLNGLNLSEVQKICNEFVFAKGNVIRTISYKRKSNRLLSLLSKKGKLKPSQIYKWLDLLSYEVLLMLMAKSKSHTARRRIMAFLTKYLNIKLSVRGDDFKKAGIKPGPHFKEMMESTLHAKIDGRIKTKEEELNYALKLRR